MSIGKSAARIAMFVFLGLSATYVSAAPSKDQPRRSWAGDGRLDRAVTVTRGRVYLGELVQELSRAGKVSLRVSTTRGPVDGMQLAAFLNARPLREVMEALAELYTTPFDKWEWQPEEGRKGYMLVHQRAPDLASELARQKLMERWIADTHTMHEVARTPRDQRAERAKLRPDLYPGDYYLHPTLDLFGSLTPAELETAIRGTFVPLDLRRLGPTGAEALKLGVTDGGGRATVTDANGTRDADALQPGVYFKWMDRSLGPQLWVRNENGVATGLAGGMGWDSRWLESQMPGWSSRLDPKAQAWRDAIRKDPALGTPGPTLTVPEWLKLVTEKQKLNFLADLVNPGPGLRTASWFGRDPEQTVRALSTRSDFVMRPSGGIHLMRQSSFLIHPRRHLVPWPVVKTLREAAIANDGFADLPQLLALSELSEEQLRGQAEEFPAAEHGLIAAWRPILQFYTNLLPELRRRVAQPDGLPLRDAGLVARSVLLEGEDSREVRNLGLLKAQTDRVIVSFSVEQSTARHPGENSVEEVRRLWWQVRSPDFPPFRSFLPLYARRPLKPVDEPSGRSPEPVAP